MYQASENRYDTMPYNRLGTSGLKLPAVSLGLWHNFGNTGRFDNMQAMCFTAFDNGKTWSFPQSTGIMGQASSLCAIGGEKLLALHAIRRDTDRPGIYGCIADFSGKKWNITERQLL